MHGAQPPKRSPLLWIALALGASCALCSVGTLGVLALGASADDGSAPRAAGGAAEGGGGEWLPAGEIARGAALTQPLPGGRWLHQSGSNLERVTARFAESVMVETSGIGTLHELRFDGDGTYQWHWVTAGNFQMRTLSAADERGTWQLDGATLTLSPSSQQARYANSMTPEPQDKEDVDLSARSYQLVDITLETVPHTGAPMRQFPGVELQGPPGPWDLERNTITLDLQRL